MSNYGEWKAVIGLEIHAELNTKSKLFSAAPNHFGDEPNENIHAVCTGQPGALPVLNKEAVHKAVQLGCALDAKVQTFSKFDRKSYFYPDSPRNFQITQLDQPIIRGGTVTTEVEGQERVFSIDRVHLEDDAGMLKHFSHFAGVDYNRAGVPLVEIVSDPCIHTPKEAAAYAMAVRAILQYIDASDCNMEEGSLRFDANISVMHKNDPGFRNKIEIKNMNSFSNMEAALTAEIQRQIQEYSQHPDKDPAEVIQQATYRWDPELRKTVIMRRKEQVDDYRYFPEPDLVPIVLKESYIEEVRRQLPELPLQRERRYVRELGLAADMAFQLTSDKMAADYFEEALTTCSNPRSLTNWILIEFAGRFKESGKQLWNSGIAASQVGELVNLIDNKTITGKIAKQVADQMLTSPGKSPLEIVKSNPDYQPVNDRDTIEPIIDQILANHQQSVSDFRTGKQKAFAFLVGQVMKETRGKASPQLVNELLIEKIGV